MRYKRPHFSTRLVLETSSFEEASCDVMRGPHGEGHVTSNCRWLLADAKNLETQHLLNVLYGPGPEPDTKMTKCIGGIVSALWVKLRG